MAAGGLGAGRGLRRAEVRGGELSWAVGELGDGDWRDRVEERSQMRPAHWVYVPKSAMMETAAQRAGNASWITHHCIATLM